MNLLQVLPLIVLIVGGLILFLIFVLIKYLRNKDLEIDYSTKEIQYYIQNINGNDYLIVPYLFWQDGKLNAIKKMFSDHFEYDGKDYKVELLYTGQKHLKQKYDIFPQSFYQDCLSVIRCNEPISVNYGNVSNMYIHGNNNHVSIQQNQYTNIKNEIQNFIINQNNLSETDKTTLEAFLYQLSEGLPKKSNTQKVIEVLNKFLPLTTAIIDMIKALYF